ncbi:MAG: flagellar basal-body rod protein FlgG [Planctomycetota bacterium]
MAVLALHSAATGLNALSTELDVIANNLANVNTTAFKTQRVNFEDLIYQIKKQPGIENSNGDQNPAGIQVGLGTKISNTQYDFQLGSALATGRDLDVFIEGDGFLEVEILTEQGGGVGYTRAGNLFTNRDGELVLGNSQGPRLADGITISDDAVNVTISADGTVTETLGDGSSSDVGQLQLTTFVNKEGLKSVGGNIYVETEASGPPISGNPGDGSLGTLLQGHLENSNVDPVTELVSLIRTQRAFELNSQTIEAADEVLQVVGNLRR